MQTRRDYLVGKGLAKPGRGKFSGAALAALDKARGDGIKFSDDDAPVRTAPKQRGVKDDGPELKTRVEAGLGIPDYVFPSDFRYPEAEYQAVAHIDGKRKVFSMRECCNMCRVSLTNHICNSPTIHENIAVTIEERK